MRVRSVAFLTFLAATGWVGAALAAGPRAYLVPDLARVRRGDIGLTGASSTKLGALRGETLGFQVIVESGEIQLDDVRVDMTALEGPGGSLGSGRLFVEHYVPVRARSRNDGHPGESLGFTASARGADAAMLGDVPDALVPRELAKGFVTYPLTVAPKSTAAMWVDVEIPTSAAAGHYVGAITVTYAQQKLETLEVSIDVMDAVLPYRPVSFFAYYDPAELRSRLGSDTRAELQLWQLLHRHHIDALAPIVTTADTTRLERMLSGDAFREIEGYDGPGQGVPPAVVALGAYGGLGDPSPAKMAVVESLANAVPPVVEDVFLYAIDEQCDSRRGANWRKLLAASPARKRVHVGHTCSEDPRKQDVDIVLTTTDAFVEPWAREAEASSRRVWVYNGQLPFAGPLVLDAPPRGLALDGWIAASRDIGRWFFWETIFWNDDNRGGRGAIDPFSTAETFHNRSGDTALLDGLLLYPGTQTPPFENRSLGFDGVFPSLRLKMLRRGIEDAGYLALARISHPIQADAIARALVPRALGEVSGDEPDSFPDGAAILAGREGLRALIAPGATLTDAGAARILREGARLRPWKERATSHGRRWLVPLAALLAVGVAWWTVSRRRRTKTTHAPR